MKDFRGHELQVSDEVYVASLGDGVRPKMERACVTDIKTHRADGQPRKEAMAFFVPLRNKQQKPVGIGEKGVGERVGIVSRALPPSDELIEKVVEEIKADLAIGDVTALEELLRFTPALYLEGYLPE